MSRRCPVTGRNPMAGNNVSHAKNRTRRRFLPNLQKISVHSDALKRSISLRLSMKGLRSLEHMGGLDVFLMRSSDEFLSTELRALKRQLISLHGAH